MQWFSMQSSSCFIFFQLLAIIVFLDVKEIFLKMATNNSRTENTGFDSLGPS